MRTFQQPLEQLEAFRAVQEQLKKNRGIVQLSGCMDSQKVHAMYGLSEGYRNKVIITYSELKAKEIYEDYQFFDKEVLYYPAKDFLFFQADIQSNLLVKERIRALQAILTGEQVTIVTTLDGCMDYLAPLNQVAEQVLTIGADSVVEIEALKQRLVAMGYERVGQVEASGQFAVRGGIIDIFPLTSETPYRIELWDDEVDSIRSFDVESQRSIENLEEIVLYPAAERKPSKKDRVCFLDYFSEADTIFFLDEPNRLLEQGQIVETEFRESVTNRMEKGEITAEEADIITSCGHVAGSLNHRSCVAFCMLDAGKADWNITGKYQITAKSATPYQSNFEVLVKDLERLKKEKYSTVLLCASRTRGKRLAADLQEYGLNSFYSEDLDRVVQGSEIMVVHGNVHKGFEYPMIKFVVLTESDIFGGEKKKKKKKRTAYEGQNIQSFSELSIGDYVVHESHGLGVYKGIEKVEVDKVIKDYMKIEYGNGANLYILATQLDKIQKYASADAKKPKLNKLGGNEWNRTKAKVRGAVREIAKDLVQLYAARQEQAGFVYGPDTVWQTEFEEMFPFEETEDQLLAIEATKKDMESRKIMDRLICGDVGYGKTEVAIRAAFKAVQENKQVVYLVPTTILAQQHYNTFVQRMKEFPVRVDLMCRFRTPAEQKKTITDLKKGLVDIVIGTHRVLSKDLVYKDLGLLIIDEEQRFGVSDKEKIKQLKENIDVLTLTATPIPRTLHMSLIGIRDMSVLEEPPMDRLPIQTYVMEYNEEMIRAAISRELARDGQVYYVYNRVDGIDEMTNQLARLVPEATVAFAHGQMKERELEKIMYQFMEGEIDVLVSTTIIETGLDISNVNTMIIHDADRLGLSQLYQLRGRVGRSNRTSYAFLMYKKDRMLSEVAEKRLQAIKEFTELGSGFKIAMRDLEIRGAGNLLGAQQHGHMQAVGYDLYCKMLNEAVKEMKGIADPDSFDTTVDLDVDAFIPASYIVSESQKLDSYKRIASLESKEEGEDILEELLDRYGEPPKSVLNLIEIACMRALAKEVYITEISGKQDRIILKLYEKARLNPQAIPDFIAAVAGDGQMKFTAGEKPQFVYTIKQNSRKPEKNLIQLVTGLLEQMKEMLL